MHRRQLRVELGGFGLHRLAAVLEEARTRSSMRCRPPLSRSSPPRRGSSCPPRQGIRLFRGAPPGEIGERRLVQLHIGGQVALGPVHVVGLGCELGLEPPGVIELARRTRRVGLERGHHVRVGRGLEGPFDRPPAFGDDTGQAPAALGQAFDARERHHDVVLALGGELGRGGIRGGVELRDGGGEAPFDLDEPGARLARHGTPLAERCQVAPHQMETQRPQLVGQRGMGPGGGRLAFERAHLAPDLPQQIAQALEVLLGGGEPSLGPLAPAPVLQDAGRLLDHRSAVLGTRVEDGAELALAHDDVLLTPDAGVREQLLDVEQPARLAVDGVLALTGAEQRAGDGDLRQATG